MADNRGKRRGPYLQYLSDSTSRNVPRTTKHRWSKKSKLTSDSQECEWLERSFTESETRNDFSTISPQSEHDKDADIASSSSPFGELYSCEQEPSGPTVEVHGVESTCFVNSWGEFGTLHSVAEMELMTEEPALFTSGNRCQDVYDHEVSFADDFPDVTEMLTEEEIDEKNTNEEYSNCNQSLYPGCRLTLEISMLLIVTFCIRHALSGVALADLLTLIELHCLLPNKCTKTTKLLRDFFGKLKSPIELHYYCLYCQEYFGTRKPTCCSNAACLCDFEKKRSQLQYFIIIPFVIQLQAIIKGKCKSDSTIRNLYI